MSISDRSTGFYMSAYHTPKNFQLTIQAELTLPDGTTKKSFPERQANSLIQAFIKLLKVFMSTQAETIKAYDGSDISVQSTQNFWDVLGAAAATNKGIVIGSGTTPVAITDYKIESQITTNVLHGAVGFTLESPDASTYVLAISRSFTNNTGSTLSITEVALYSWIAPSSKGLCHDRTLYSVDVPAGLAVTFTYRIYITL
jgi:hypothetical protein